MEKLDNNVLFKILYESEPMEVMQLCIVNKKFAKLCKTPGVFDRLLEMHFPKDEFKIAYDWFAERNIRDSKTMYIRLTENYGVRYKIRIELEKYYMYGDLEYELVVAEDAYKIKINEVNKPLDKFEYYFRVPAFKNLKNGVLLIEEVSSYENVGIDESIIFFESMDEACDWFYQNLDEIARKEYYMSEYYMTENDYNDYNSDEDVYIIDNRDEDVYKTKKFVKWLDEHSNISDIYNKNELLNVIGKDKYLEIGNSRYNFKTINLKS